MLSTILVLLQIISLADDAVKGFWRSCITLIRIVRFCVRYAGWNAPWSTSHANQSKPKGNEMANYTPPVYNTEINIWHDGTDTSDPPDATATVNFAWDRRGHTDSVDPSDPGKTVPFMTVLAPSTTDLRGYIDNAAAPDTIEVPAGSGRFYLVHYVDYIGMGFSNEHLGADVYMQTGGPVLPGILMEDSGFVLMEDGVSHILMES